VVAGTSVNDAGLELTTQITGVLPEREVHTYLQTATLLRRSCCELCAQTIHGIVVYLPLSGKQSFLVQCSHSVRRNSPHATHSLYFAQVQFKRAHKNIILANADDRGARGAGDQGARRGARARGDQQQATGAASAHDDAGRGVEPVGPPQADLLLRG
jgi:hypothetical protein